MVRSLAFPWFVLWCGIASARPGDGGLTIAVGSDDTGFTRALESSLAVYAPNLIEIADHPDRATIARASHAIATREHAQVVVWMTSSPHTTLLVFDVTHDQLLERAFPYRAPLDAADAFEAARAVRTMIHTLSLNRGPTPVDGVAASPPPNVDHAVIDNVASPPTEHVTLGIAVGAGMTSSGDVAFTGEAIWRPDRVGAMAVVDATSTDVADPGFSGRLADRAVAAYARVPLDLAHDVRLSAVGGAAVHALSLDGVLMDGAPATDRRLDVSLRVGVGASHAIAPRVDLGFHLVSDTMLQRPRYVVRGDEVGLVPRVRISGVLLLGVGLW